MVELVVIGEFLPRGLRTFPRPGRIAAFRNLLRLHDGRLDQRHFFQNLAELFLLLGIKRGGGDEAHPVLENLPVVVLLKQPVEIIHRLLLHIGLGEDRVPHLRQRGVARPNLGGGAEFLFHRRLVARNRSGAGFGEVHRADRLGRLDLRERLAGVEILRDLFQFGHEFFGAREIVHFQRGEEFVALACEFQGAPFVIAREETHAGHVFAKGESLGETLGGALEFALLEKEFVSINTLVHIANRFAGEAVDLAEGANEFADALGCGRRAAGEAFHADVFESHLRTAGGEGAAGAAATAGVVVNNDICPLPIGSRSGGGLLIQDALRARDARVEFGIQFGLPGIFVHRQGVDHFLVNLDRVVAVLVNGAVEAVGNDHMLEPPRGEILHDKRLEVAFRGEFERGDAELIVLDRLPDVGEFALCRGHAGVALDLDVLLSQLGDIGAGGGVEDAVLSGHLVVPLGLAEIFFQLGIVSLELGNRFEALTRGVDRVGHRPAEVGVIPVFGGLF